MIETSMLKILSIFYELSVSELEAVAGVCEYKIYQPGEIIMREGEPGGTLYIIKKGEIKITRHFHHQEDIVLTILRDGEFFGELSLLDGRTRSASAIAMNKAELILLSKDKFDPFAEKFPGAGYKIIRRITIVVGSLLRDMNEKFIGMINYMWR